MSIKLDLCCVKDCENKGMTQIMVPHHGCRMICYSHHNYVTQVIWEDTEIYVYGPHEFEILSRSPLRYTGSDMAIMRADPSKYVKPEKVIWINEMTSNHDQYRKKELARFFALAHSRQIELTDCPEKPFIEKPLTVLERFTINQCPLMQEVNEFKTSYFDISSISMFRIGIISLEASHNYAKGYMTTKINPFHHG
jgi:hypothetical protein